MNHGHDYRFWHAHGHDHVTKTYTDNAGNDGYLCHDHGHHHVFSQTHQHGKKMGALPHSHQARQAHPGDDNAPGGYKHHHATEGHEKED